MNVHTQVSQFTTNIVNWSRIIFITRYTEKISKLSDKLYDMGVKVTTQREDDFNVIIHGDFWVNNMLFKYHDGKPIDHIFVSIS